jgi:hypothetical protein
MKKYGNTILVKSILKTIMPNGLYPKDLLDANLIQYSGYHFNIRRPQISGFASVKWNTSTSVFDIISQTEDSAISAVTKVNDYTIQITFKHNIDIGKPLFTFSRLPNIVQYATSSPLFLTRLYSLSLNTLSFIIYKTDGTLVTATDYTNSPNAFYFVLSF